MMSVSLSLLYGELLFWDIGSVKFDVLVFILSQLSGVHGMGSVRVSFVTYVENYTTIS